MSWPLLTIIFRSNKECQEFSSPVWCGLFQCVPLRFHPVLRLPCPHYVSVLGNNTKGPLPLPHSSKSYPIKLIKVPWKHLFLTGLNRSWIGTWWIPSPYHRFSYFRGFYFIHQPHIRDLTNQTYTIHPSVLSINDRDP